MGEQVACDRPAQVFANFYLNPLDHYVKHTLGMRSYGRYVDDFVIVHQDRSRLDAAIPVIRDFLSEHLGLTLHPRKIHLQPAHRGVQYLGTVIKPGRTIIANRTKGNFAAAVERFNRLTDSRKPSPADRARFQSSINSYLGILRHYATRRLRAVTLGRLSPWWRRYFVPVYEAERRSGGAETGHGGTGDNRIPTVVSVNRHA
jgi:RNA-directed DNA polymerase